MILPLVLMAFFGKINVCVVIKLPIVRVAVLYYHPSTMAIQAVLFDLGETLFNYGEVNVNAYFLQGARLTYDYLRQLAGGKDKFPSFKKYHRRHVVSIKWHYFWSNVKNREFDCMALLHKEAWAMGLSLEQGQLERLAWLWYQPLGESAAIEADLACHLQKLSDMSLKLAIISNTFLPSLVLDRHLEQFDLLRFFPVRTYSSDTFFRKPDRRIYEITLKRLGVSAEAAVMVGDKLREDVKGPAQLGIKAVFKRGCNNRKKRVPSHVPVIDNIAELPALIRDWQK